MNLAVSGMVLSVTASGEHDRFCTILTDTHGVIRAFAKGAKNMKNKNATATAQFVYGHFELYRRRDYYVIDESQYEELNLGVRDDIFRLAAAQYLCQLVMKLVPEAAPSREAGADSPPEGDYLRLMRMAIYYLSENTRPPKLVKAVTEMRLLSMAGYMPNLLMCIGCGAYEHDTMYFITLTGNLLCENCAPYGEEQGKKLSRGALMAMRHAVFADIHKLFAFTLSEESIDQFYQASEKYAIYKIEKMLPTLAFLRSLM